MQTTRSRLGERPTTRLSPAPSGRRLRTPSLPHAENGTRIDEPLGPSSLEIPSDLEALAGRLLDQQLWCWGRDVARREGNLLIDYGFERHVPDGRAVQTSSYSAKHPCGDSLALWSWGLFYGCPACGGLFLRRTSIAPCLTAESTCPHPHWPVGVLPRHRRPRTPEEAVVARTLLVRVARWIGRFEEWIRRTVGSEHRAACLREWHRVIGDSESLAGLWTATAEEIERRATVIEVDSVPDPTDGESVSHSRS